MRAQSTELVWILDFKQILLLLLLGNIHTLIRKMLQTNIPDTIIKFIANYIKGCKTYTTYRNHTSIQRKFKTGVPKVGVLSLTLFNISLQTYHHPEHWIRSCPTQMTSPSHPHNHECSQEKHTNTTIHTYSFCLDKTSHTKFRQNSLFTPDLAENKSNLDLKIISNALPIAMHIKVLGLTLDPKLTYNTHIHNISVQ